MIHPTRTIRGLVVAVVALAALGIGVAAASTPAAAAARPAGLVVAPATGAVRSAPVQVILNVGSRYTLARISVTLNGRPVTRAFRTVSAGRRSAALDAGHGLRYGRNVLRVVLRPGIGSVRRQTVVFRVAGVRPLVGAGLDRRTAVGLAIRLDASASRPTPAAARTGTRALTARWRLVSRPRGSRTVLSPAAARSLRPLLRPDRVGRYLLRLQVRDAAAASLPAAVQVQAVAPTPQVPIETAVSGTNSAGQTVRGIAVGYRPSEVGYRAPNPLQGEQFFPLPAGQSLIAVALDRQTLAPLPGGLLTAAPGPGVGVALTSFIGQFASNALILVGTYADPDWSQFGPLPGTQLSDVLTGIGAQQIGGLAQLADAPVLTGTTSWIGVPGFAPGQGWQRVTSPSIDGGEPAGLDGVLSPDVNDNYAYLDASPQTFDLGPDGQSVTMSVGGSTWTASLPAGQGGFAVLYLAAATLQPYPVPGGGAQPFVYVTSNADGSPNAGGMTAMANQLAAVRNIAAPVTIVIRSIGSPLAQAAGQPQALDSLAFNIGQAGGKSNWIWRMATAPGPVASYSLVGRNGLNEGQAPARDLGSAMQPPPPSTRFSGTLLRDRGSNYEVRAAGPGAALSDPLSQVLFAAPSQWPVPSTPGQQQALVCIGDAQSLGPDPRISYWLEPYSQGRWGQIQQQIRAMVPMQCPGVSARDFAAVQAALAQEIGWLINTRSYFASLTEPFAQGSQVGLTDVQQIVTDVTQAIAVPPAANAGISGWGIAADIFDAIDFFGGEVEIPGAALFSALFNVAGSLSTSTQDGAPFVWRQKVQATGAQIATATALQLQQIAAGNRRVADIVVADYQKLKTVGTLGGCAPGTPGCAPAWQYTQPQQQATQDLLNISIKRKAWAGLMPAAYPYVLYVNSNPGSYNGTFEGPQTDIGGVGCGFTQQFPLAPPVDLQFGLVQPANTSFLVFAQSNFPGGGGGAPFDAFPPSSLLTNGQASPGAQGQPPFAPLDAGGDPTRGGLGLDQYGFMMESWPWGTPPPVRAEWQGCRS